MSTDNIFVLFNRKVEWLEDLPFTSWLDQQEAGSILDYSDESGWGSVFVGPSESDFHTFILTLRLFAQDNDAVSLRRLREAYEKEVRPRDVALFDRVQVLHADVNALLDRETNLGITESSSLTKRQIVDMYIYGDAAHLNTKKRKQIAEIRATPMFPIFQTLLTEAFRDWMTVLRATRALNETALPLLGVGDTSSAHVPH